MLAAYVILLALLRQHDGTSATFERFIVAVAILLLIYAACLLLLMVDSVRRH